MKRVHIEGDVDLGTEPNKIVELFDGIFHLITHRTRPIKNEDQTVVLTIGNNIDLRNRSSLYL